MMWKAWPVGIATLADRSGLRHYRGDLRLPSRFRALGIGHFANPFGLSFVGNFVEGKPATVPQSAQSGTQNDLAAASLALKHVNGLHQTKQGRVIAMDGRKPWKIKNTWFDPEDVVLSKGETDRLLAGMSGTFQLMAKLLYGAGLRLMECVRLRVQDVDFELNQIVVRDAGFCAKVIPLLTELRGK